MGVPVKFFRGDEGDSLPSVLEGGAIYMIPLDGIYMSTATSSGSYPGNEYQCYANYTKAIKVFASGNSLGLKINLILWHDGNNFYNSNNHSVGIQILGKSGSIHYASPQLVKNSSGSWVLACYTGDHWVLATSPATTVTIGGKMESKTIEPV